MAHTPTAPSATTIPPLDRPSLLIGGAKTTTHTPAPQNPSPKGLITLHMSLSSPSPSATRHGRAWAITAPSRCPSPSPIHPLPLMAAQLPALRPRERRRREMGGEGGLSCHRQGATTEARDDAPIVYTSVAAQHGTTPPYHYLTSPRHCTAIIAPTSPTVSLVSPLYPCRCECLGRRHVLSPWKGQRRCP
jgi:hypothetical protein